jgi:hypothetical protein
LYTCEREVGEARADAHISATLLAATSAHIERYRVKFLVEYPYAATSALFSAGLVRDSRKTYCSLVILFSGSVYVSKRCGVQDLVMTINAPDGLRHSGRYICADVCSQQ